MQGVLPTSRYMATHDGAGHGFSFSGSSGGGESSVEAGTKARELGVQLERLKRHARAGLAVHVGRTIDRGNAERMLDVESKAIGDLVGARFGRAEKSKRLGRDTPGTAGVAAHADGNHRLDLRHQIRRPMAGRGHPVDGIQIGNPGAERSLAQAVVQHLAFCGGCIDGFFHALRLAMAVSVRQTNLTSWSLRAQCTTVWSLRAGRVKGRVSWTR